MQDQPGVEQHSFDDEAGTSRPFDDTGEPNVVRLSLDAGESVAPHTHAGRRVLFYALDGRFEVTVGGERHLLSADDCLRFDGDQAVSPAATGDEPATALVVLAKQ